MSDARSGPPEPLEFHDFQLSPLSSAWRTFRRLHPHVRRHVRNWLSSDLRYLRRAGAVARGRRGKDDPYEIVVRLRGSGEELRLATVREYHFFVEALYLADQVLGPAEAEKATATIVGLMQSIRTRLLATFTREEIDRVATGGYPALKEIVLFLLVRRYRPRSSVETGVAQGISSTFLLRAMQENGVGELVSIDLPNYDPKGRVYEDAEHTLDRTYVKRELGPGWLVPEELRPRWRLLLGSSADLLPTLSDRRLDLFFHDSEHSYENMAFEYRWGWEHLLPGGLLVSDDIHWNAAFREFVAAHPGELTLLAERRVGAVLRGGARPG